MLRFVQKDAPYTPFDPPEGMPRALASLLARRGVASPEEAVRFLNPSRADLNDPMALQDMDQALSRILRARDQGEKVAVYGDYDVDGVCAAAMLSQHLTSMGMDVVTYLPSRHDEGYGLNDAAMARLATEENCRLMVTVDCGVTCPSQVRLAKALGMDSVVTDHHRLGDEMPDCPVVNPLREGYPFPHLCGAGVAFKLIHALSGEDAAMAYADLAALATVADVVPLTGENRAIVKMGLEQINQAPRCGVKALISAAGLDGRGVTAGNVAFQLAPRLNAGGRLGSARRSLALLTQTDPGEALLQAAELEGENASRKQVEKEILDAAEEQLQGFDFPAHRILVLAGAGWNPGVIGLAASRITEKYHYPSIMIALDGDQAVGSCRSIPGVDIFEALCQVKHLFSRFGGHSQAAGLSMAAGDIPLLQAGLDRFLFESADPDLYVPALEYDMALPLRDVTTEMTALMDMMQPTGFGNPAPVLRCSARVEEARSVGAGGAHLKLVLSDRDRRLDAIRFREGGRAASLKGADVDALYVPKLNCFNGRISVQMELKALNFASLARRLRAAQGSEAEMQVRFLTEMLYNGGQTPAPRETPAYTQQVKDWLSDPQGTLIAAASLSDAEGLLPYLGDGEGDWDAVDLALGAWPDDPRRFNALTVLPAGEPPRGWRRVVLAGAPRGMALPPEAEVFRLEGFPRPDWFGELPDVPALRCALKALIGLSARPLAARNRLELAGVAGREAGLSRLNMLAALSVLEECGILRVNEAGDGPAYEILTLQKTDLTASRRFLLLEALRDDRTKGGDGA